MQRQHKLGNDSTCVFFWKELKKEKRSDAFPCSDDLWRLRAREYSFEQATMTRPRMTSSSAAEHRCSIVRPPRVILKDENSKGCAKEAITVLSATSMSAFTIKRYESCSNWAVFNDRNLVNTLASSVLSITVKRPALILVHNLCLTTKREITKHCGFNCG